MARNAADVNNALKGARDERGLSRDDVARMIRDAGPRVIGEGNECNRANIERWENGGRPSGRYVRLLSAVFDMPASELGLAATGADYGPAPRDTGLDLLDPVPQAFDAERISGPWLTSYLFNGELHHADIATITVTGSKIRASNYPPEPRTEKRSMPFRNEIEAFLVGRHLMGVWRNTSDTRYYGSVHLAVHSGETVMEGWFTNLVSDVEVGVGSWKWVKVDPASLAYADLSTIELRDPAELYELVMKHTRYDAPLALSDLGKVA